MSSMGFRGFWTYRKFPCDGAWEFVGFVGLIG